MNAKQISALQYITSKIDDKNRFQDENSNGAVAFEIEQNPDGSIWLYASNADSKAWYETYIHVIVLVGPRGGIKVQYATGIEKSQLI